MADRADLVKPDNRVIFGRAEYYIAILGPPSTSERWMVQFGGHHLAINVTVGGTSSVLTPTHTGAQPATYTLNGQTLRPLGRENDKAFALINSLDESQRKQAILGSRCRTSCSAQISILEGAAATAKSAEVKATLNDTYFAWSESTTNGQAAYFRVQGPTVFIEYAPQGAAGTDHIHTVYRDPTNDYGAKMAAR